MGKYSIEIRPNTNIFILHSVNISAITCMTIGIYSLCMCSRDGRYFISDVTFFIILYSSKQKYTSLYIFFVLYNDNNDISIYYDIFSGEVVVLFVKLE